MAKKKDTDKKHEQLARDLQSGQPLEINFAKGNFEQVMVTMLAEIYGMLIRINKQMLEMNFYTSHLVPEKNRKLPENKG